MNQYDNSDDATWQARRRRNLTGGSAMSWRELDAGKMSNDDWKIVLQTAKDLGVRASGCWCQGELCLTSGLNYNWVGLEDGEPHPRDLEDLAFRIEKRMDEHG